MMKLALDTDAFCKLGVCRLLPEATRVFEAELTQCGRLSALPYMLRRGRLRRTYGVAEADKLAELADTLPVLPQPDHSWLDLVTPISAIYPGEALIYAAAAQYGLYLVSGDKRALRALAHIDAYRPALAGRIASLEAVLIALCADYGADLVRRRCQALVSSDKVMRACFSPGNPDPTAALLSYNNSLIREVSPLVLWDPVTRGSK